jgi:hypothetical protein
VPAEWIPASAGPLPDSASFILFTIIPRNLSVKSPRLVSRRFMVIVPSSSRRPLLPSSPSNRGRDCAESCNVQWISKRVQDSIHSELTRSPAHRVPFCLSSQSCIFSPDDRERERERERERYKIVHNDFVFMLPRDPSNRGNAVKENDVKDVSLSFLTARCLLSRSSARRTVPNGGSGRKSDKFVTWKSLYRVKGRRVEDRATNFQ